MDDVQHRQSSWRTRGCRGLMRVALLTAALGCLPAVAFAHPCTAPLNQRAGDTFSGIVRYIGDGDSLCVGPSDDENTWIEVRLADFNAPELASSGGPAAKAMLERIAMGRRAQCVAGGGRTRRVISYDRVIASCRINGRRIGDLLREAGAERAGDRALRLGVKGRPHPRRQCATWPVRPPGKHCRRPARRAFRRSCRC